MSNQSAEFSRIGEASPFGSAWSHLGLALGPELEQLQRTVLMQIKKYLPEVSAQLNEVWSQRDKDFEAMMGKVVSVPAIPEVENYFTGNKPSLIEAEVNMFPNISVWAHDAQPSSFQADLYDTVDETFYVEVMCSAGPVTQAAELHKTEGVEVEMQLDSMLNRLTDAVHLCVKKDPTLGNVLAGAISLPPTIQTSLPWSRKEEKGLGNYYIFQGKRLRYTAQRNSF